MERNSIRSVRAFLSNIREKEEGGGGILLLISANIEFRGVRRGGRLRSPLKASNDISVSFTYTQLVTVLNFLPALSRAIFTDFIFLLRIMLALSLRRK